MAATVYQCPHGMAPTYLIPPLHDEAGSTSWLVQLTYISVRRLLDVCSMFA